METEGKLDSNQVPEEAVHYSSLFSPRPLVATDMRSSWMRNLEKNARLVGKIFLATLFVVTFFYFVKVIQYHYTLVTYPLPMEYRETAMLVTTELIAKAVNPYTLEKQPEFTNLYGIVYHLVAAPFTKIFGRVTSLIVHKAISAIFIFGSCSVLFLVMRRLNLPLFYILPAVVIFHIHLLFFTTPLPRPDSLGLFLFLLSISLPWFHGYSSKSLAISLVLGLVAFYTKMYFVLSVLYMGSYLFCFVSKKKGIGYIILFCLLLVSTALCINHFWDCYFYNSFINHNNVGIYDFKHVITQFKLFIRYNIGVSLLLITCVLFQFVRLFRLSKENEIDFNGIQRNQFIVNWFDLERPLLDVPCPLFLFCGLWSLLLLTFKFGGHTGTLMTYFYQILFPFFIIGVLTFATEKHTSYLLIVPLLIINLYASGESLQRLDIDSKDLNEWAKVERLLRKNRNILNSPAIGALMFNEGERIYDSGQGMYFQYSSPHGSILKRLFPLGDRIERRNRSFLDEISKSIRMRKYDAIILDTDYDWLASKEMINEYYEIKDSMSLFMPHTGQRWKLYLWKAKNGV